MVLKSIALGSVLTSSLLVVIRFILIQNANNKEAFKVLYELKKINNPLRLKSLFYINIITTLLYVILYISCISFFLWGVVSQIHK